MATSSAPLGTSPKQTWIEKSGGLPPGVRKVARALRREHPEWSLSRCIATALSRSKAWAAKGSAKGARNVAQWEATRARNAARTATTAIAIHEHAVVELSARRATEVPMTSTRPPFGGAKKTKPATSSPPTGTPKPTSGPDPDQMDDTQLDAALARAKSAAESQTGESAQRMAQMVIRLEAIKNRRKGARGSATGSATTDTANPRGRAVELSQPADRLAARAQRAVAQLGLADLGS